MKNMITVKPKMIKGMASIPQIKGMKEGDFGIGAYFLVAGAIGNEVVCNGIKLKSKQTNAKIIDIIKMAGGKIVKTKDGVSAKMTGVMKGININLNGMEELLLPVALLCAFLKGESRISGLISYGNDLICGIASEFNHLGIYTEITSNGLYIKGEQVIRSDGAYSWNNSDLAMALVLAGCRSEGELNILGANLDDEKLKVFMKLYNKLIGGK